MNRYPKTFLGFFKLLIILTIAMISITFTLIQCGKNSNPRKDHIASAEIPTKFIFVSKNGSSCSVQNPILIENDFEKEADSEQAYNWIDEYKRNGGVISDEATCLPLNNALIPRELKDNLGKQYSLFFKNQSIPIKCQDWFFVGGGLCQLFAMHITPTTTRHTIDFNKEPLIILEKPHPSIQYSEVSEIASIHPSNELIPVINSELEANFKLFLEKKPTYIDSDSGETINADSMGYPPIPRQIDWYSVKSQPDYVFIIATWRGTVNAESDAILGVYRILNNNTPNKLIELFPLSFSDYPCLEIRPRVYFKMNNRRFALIDHLFYEGRYSGVYEILPDSTKPWQLYAKSFYYGQ